MSAEEAWDWRQRWGAVGMEVVLGALGWMGSLRENVHPGKSSCNSWAGGEIEKNFREADLWQEGVKAQEREL